jgi:hypothetical protein
VGAAIKLPAVAILPPVLQKKAFEQARLAFQHMLEASQKDGGISFVPVSQLATFCGASLARLRGQAGATEVAELLAHFGCGVEPDPMIHFRGWSDSLVVAIFPLTSRIGSPAHSARCALVQMAAFVLRAGNCGQISESPAVQEIIAPVKGTPEEICLVALGKLFEHNPVKELFRPTRVVANIPPEKRPAIARALVRIAVIDDFLSIDEENALWTLFNAMDLPTADGRQLIKDSGAMRESAGGARQTLASDVVRGQLKLDPNRLKELEAETAAVGAILASAMQEGPEDDSREENATPIVAPAERASPAIPAWLASLDPLFISVVQEIVQRDQWPKGEFKELAQRHKQMPGAVVDGINLWSMDALGDMLLTGDDPIEVNRTLLPAA